MKIIITIDTENDAFQQDLRAELEFVLVTYLTKVVRGQEALEQVLFDSNGNTVGLVTID